jgi:hypothetical protein
MRYATPAAFRQALDDRLKIEAATTGLSIARLRKRVAFELFLRRLVAVAPGRWILKGALALDFRFPATSRPTRDMDFGRADDEDAAIEDFAAAQELALDDFFTFAARRTDGLDDADDVHAIRFHITAELAGRVFDEFVVDVGFADEIASTPDTIETSDLLSFAGIERIRVPALPLPQHIAEKVHAYTRTYGQSGRQNVMKGASSVARSACQPKSDREGGPFVCCMLVWIRVGSVWIIACWMRVVSVSRSGRHRLMEMVWPGLSGGSRSVTAVWVCGGRSSR